MQPSIFFKLFSAINYELLPVTDTYNFSTGNWSAKVFFERYDSNNFRIEVTVYEADNTVTKITGKSGYLLADTWLVSKADDDIKLEVSGDNNETYLVVNGDHLLSLDAAEQHLISSTDRLSYVNNSVTVFNAAGHAEGFHDAKVFSYYDGYQFYHFFGNKINALKGSGVLYHDHSKYVAMYFINSNLSQLLNEAYTDLQDFFKPEYEGSALPAITPTLEETYLITEDDQMKDENLPDPTPPHSSTYYATKWYINKEGRLLA